MVGFTVAAVAATATVAIITISQGKAEEEVRDDNGATNTESSPQAVNSITNVWNGFMSGMQNKTEEMRISGEAKKEGKIYDSETKTWKFYHLADEMEEVDRLEREIGVGTGGLDGASGEERVVADREYYDLLGVSTNTDSGGIKKAYYKAARKCHPDKNPDDPEAHDNFQKLGQAYQVLSNEQTRESYDKHGKQETGAENLSDVDPFVFFNVMFGSALVEPYIGELWIAQTSDSMMNDKAHGSLMEGLEDDSISEVEKSKIINKRLRSIEKKNELKQRKRQNRCAQNLRDRVQPYVDSKTIGKLSPVDANTTKPLAAATEDGPTVDQVTMPPSPIDPFVESCRTEAESIAKGAYGALYCITIGYSLQMAAEEYIGFERTFLGLGGVAARSKKIGSAFGTNMKLIGATIKAASAGSKAIREAENLQQHQQHLQATGSDGGGSGSGGEDAAASPLDEAAMAATIDESLPAFLEFTWAINKRDIQGTLKKVCQKLFEDGVSKETRLVRAEGVRVMGQEFYRIGKEHEAVAKESGEKNKVFDAEDIKARVAVATMTTMAKAQGQEVTEADQEEMIKQTKKMSKEKKEGGGVSTEETAGGDEKL